MRRNSVRVLGVTTVATMAVLTLTLASSSQATLPGRDGRIAYMVKDGAGHWQIWVANSDLSGGKKLTHGTYDSGWPVWSPNGKQLAFDSDRTDHTPNDSHQVNDVFVMKPDGSGVKKLTDSKGVNGDDAWSPDGSLIAFDSTRASRKGFSAIYVMRANGTKLRPLTHPKQPLSDYKPRFSPDGTHIVFTREHGTADFGPAALFTMRLDGSHLRRLTPFSLHADDSDWSPDGKHIVFDGYPNPNAYGDIYGVGATGGSVVNLTKNPAGQAGSADPAWSPDGKKILFLDNRVLNGVPRTGLATMNPDGSDRQFVSSKNVEAHQADWESIGATSARKLTSAHPRAENEQLTVFLAPGDGIAQIVGARGGRQRTIWRCPGHVFCGQPVSFAWAPDGRRVAFSLDELGGTSPYVGVHVVDVVEGRDRRVPEGAPRIASTTDDLTAWMAYLKKTADRIGCGQPADFAWSPGGSRLAYDCMPLDRVGGHPTGSQVNVLRLHGSGHSTVPTGSDAFWPSWSPSGTRIAYSTRLRPSKAAAIYTIALDGSHRRLMATGGAAPAWSPDGRTIAYQTICGIHLVDLASGRDAKLSAPAQWCQSGPPAWSPDGTKLAFETSDGLVYEMDKRGKALREMTGQGAPTWYGTLPGRPSWRAMR
jgi:Tol biopolymer transport system component